jgi:hypothetical protein
MPTTGAPISGEVCAIGRAAGGAAAVGGAIVAIGGGCVCGSAASGCALRACSPLNAASQGAGPSAESVASGAAEASGAPHSAQKRLLGAFSAAQRAHGEPGVTCCERGEKSKSGARGRPDGRSETERPAPVLETPRGGVGWIEGASAGPRRLPQSRQNRRASSLSRPQRGHLTMRKGNLQAPGRQERSAAIGFFSSAYHRPRASRTSSMSSSAAKWVKPKPR